MEGRKEARRHLRTHKPSLLGCRAPRTWQGRLTSRGQPPSLGRQWCLPQHPLLASVGPNPSQRASYQCAPIRNALLTGLHSLASALPLELPRTGLTKALQAVEAAPWSSGQSVSLQGKCPSLKTSLLRLGFQVPHLLLCTSGPCRMPGCPSRRL